MTQPPTSLEDALAAWDRWSEATGMRSSTSAYYRTIAKRFLPWLETRTRALRDVTLQDVEQFLISLDRLSTTQNTYRTALRHFFDALVTAGFLSSNPIPTKHHGAYRRRSEAIAANPSVEADWTLEQFASWAAVEKQATVDAAAWALLLHSIHLFTKGEGGAPSDVDLCDRVLRLGEQHGITPYSWAEENSLAPKTHPDSSDESVTPNSVPNEETRQS
jgi:hypothetical protein